MKLISRALLLTLVFGVSCTEKRAESLDLIGVWRAELNLIQDSMSLPFFLEFIQSDSGLKAAIWNGDESIVHHRIERWGDSIAIPSPYFNSTILAKLDRNRMSGYWVDSSREGNYRLDFSAKFNLPHRFSLPDMFTDKIDGIWQVIFSPGTDNAYPAIGIFKTDENSMKGTFITETGDYRFLEGGFGGDVLKLSAFDGSHAFLFDSKLEEDTLRGRFYSGKHYKERFIAWRNDSAKLSDPYTLTSLIDPKATVAFSARDLDGNEVTFPGPAFEKKALLLQIMGSWCPNCMDESAFLAPKYNELKEQNVEIVALAFERLDFEKAVPVLKKMRRNLGITYSVLYAGKAGKKQAAETLPFLEGIKSYPTLIYVKPNGEVFRIHTGFYGPGTGKYFELQSQEMLDDINKLVRLSFP